MPIPLNANVITVTELNRYARELLETGLPPVWVGGEISNLTLAASGHAYFSLKDKGAQIRAVMFRNRLSGLGFRLREGMQIEARGTVTLYEARGDYQINVAELREAGLGRLFEAFEQLKAKLALQGLFDNSRKKLLPPHPKAIGVVTSLQAAALRDVLSTLRRRMPAIPVIVYPTPVQGETAAAQIATAIRTASERAEVDVLIVCRGGGSIEDLWSFNEEIVARAVADCPIPLVSGVGHETDFTICDFVADVRAPTPTAAAELVTPDRAALLLRTAELRRRLAHALERQLHNKAQRLDLLARRLTHPGERIARQRERLVRDRRLLAQLATMRIGRARYAFDTLAARLERAEPAVAPRERQVMLDADRLRRAAGQLLMQRRTQVERLAERLAALNPAAVLARGYAIVERHNGHAARSPDELAQGERVRLRLALGETEAVVSHPPAQSSLF